MSETTDKFTPGPWKRITHGRVIFGTGDEEDDECTNLIADVFGRTDEETEANTRLIAAAPELLAACREALWTIKAIFNLGSANQNALNSSHDACKEAISASGCGDFPQGNGR